MNRGLTTLELLLAILILGILAAFILPIFAGLRNATELNESARDIVFLLRRAQTLSQSFTSSTEWGVRVDTSTTPFYELRTSNPTTTVETFYLPQRLSFATSTDVVFEKRSGRNKSAANKTVTILRKDGRGDRTIQVSKEGKIEY